VVPEARQRFDSLAAAGTGPDLSLEIVAGSFRDQPLPQGFDIISLVRVLYDHNDVTVGRLLSAVYTALPPGGRVIVSEPMTGGARPERAGDAYFALYCMAMRTGRARSAEEIMVLLRSAGFENVKAHPSPRPFITSVVEAVRLD
jgi:demethylspheroidene O-methyltransferase